MQCGMTPIAVIRRQRVNQTVFYAQQQYEFTEAAFTIADLEHRLIFFGKLWISLAIQNYWNNSRLPTVV